MSYPCLNPATAVPGVAGSAMMPQMSVANSMGQPTVGQSTIGSTSGLTSPTAVPPPMVLASRPAGSYTRPASLNLQSGASTISRQVAAANVEAASPAGVPQQRAILEKIEALEKETREAKARLQATQEETQTMKLALAEARAAKADAAVMAVSAGRSRSLPTSAPLPTFEPCGEQLIGKLSMEELDCHYDVVVIGGGPVGVAAAMKAAVLGHRAIIVDKPKIAPMPNGLDVSFGGPTGLWSKALRDTGKHLDVPSMQSMHLDDDVIWHQVRNMCVRLASANASHQVKTISNFKIAYLQASATVVDCKHVLVDQGNTGGPVILQTDFVLVATGSKPMRPKEIPFDDNRIFDSDTINALGFLPKSVAVLGSGIIAIEYAKIFRKLGAKVCMIVRSECLSALERIGLDHDIAQKLIEVLHDDDVAIYENTSVAEWDVPRSREEGPLTLKLKSKNQEVPKQIKVDVFLAATGRTANISGWGAEKIGIKISEKGTVTVNDNYETSVAGVYAVGDVIGPPSLASTGVYQAQAAMLEMFGQGHMNKFDAFPVGMWTTPECGYYGMTLAAAKKKGIDAKEGCVTYDACLRGRVFAPVGLLKLVFRVDDGVIIGVHILGDDACELVHFGMDLVKQEVSIFKVMTTCFTAVTYHELFKEAALHGNSQLEFGMEWHKILSDIGAHLDNHEHELDMEKMQRMFHEADTDNDGHLGWKELRAMFHNYGCKIDRATAANMVRLAAAPGECTVGWDQFEKIFDILEDVRDNSFWSNENQDAPDSPKSPASPTSPTLKRKSLNLTPRLTQGLGNGLDKVAGA